MINTLMIIAKGLAMGAADIVPGVSGGTIALLTGIYQRLIHAITAINLHSLSMLLKGHWRSFWQAVDGRFVVPLLAGIVLAFVLFSHVIKHAIQHHPILMWSFFFGLIIASAIIIVRNIPNKRPLQYFWLVPGMAFGFWIATQTGVAFPQHPLAFLLAGMIAICAMILPGISGSFILLLLGMYQPLLTAVTERQWGTMVLFMVGAVIGLMTFSRFIKWLLNRYLEQTLFFLSGLMLGSLVKIWPWKTDAVTNIWPSQHPQPQILSAITMLVIALVLVFGVDHLGRRFSTSGQSA